MRDYPLRFSGLRGETGLDPQLDRLFSTLEAQFGASIDRAEEEAASDLALSLRQDLGLRDALLLGPCTVLTESGQQSVCEVAKDHVRAATGPALIPLAAATFEMGGDTTPVDSSTSLTQALRAEGRGARTVSVETRDRITTGRVSACSEEHLSLLASGREVLIPLGQIRSIRLSPED